MKVPAIWMLIGCLALAACGPPGTPLPMPDTPQAVQTVTMQTEAPLSTAEPRQASPSETAQISPLPTPTPMEAAIISPVETPDTPQAGAEKEFPGRLTGAMGEAAVIFQRSGGFAGLSEGWAIYPDGRVTASDGREWQASPERVERLLADIEALGFFEMRDRYMPLNTCCDRFTYEVTIRRGDKLNQVTTLDAAPDTPPELWQILDTVSSFVASLQ